MRTALFVVTFEVLNLQDTVGNFLPGKKFDAVIIDPNAGMIDIFPEDSFMDIFQKCFYLASPLNVDTIYVNGKVVMHQGRST